MPSPSRESAPAPGTALSPLIPPVCRSLLPGISLPPLAFLGDYQGLPLRPQGLHTSPRGKRCARGGGEPAQQMRSGYSIPPHKPNATVSDQKLLARPGCSLGQTRLKQRRFPTWETPLPRGRAQHSLSSLPTIPRERGEDPTLRTPVHSRHGPARFGCRSGRALAAVQGPGCKVCTARPRLRRNRLRWGLWHPLCTRGIGSSERASD